MSNCARRCCVDAYDTLQVRQVAVQVQASDHAKHGQESALHHAQIGRLRRQAPPKAAGQCHTGGKASLAKKRPTSNCMPRSSLPNADSSLITVRPAAIWLLMDNNVIRDHLDKAVLGKDQQPLPCRGGRQRAPSDVAASRASEDLDRH